MPDVRHRLAGKLSAPVAEECPYFSGTGGDAAQAEDLIEQDKRGKRNRCSNGDSRAGNREAELRGADSVGAGAPKNDACSKPLKCDRGSVQAEAVHLGRLRHREQLADASSSKPGHGDGKKNQDEREVPGHGDR